MRSYHQLNKLYLHYHNAYVQQTCQVGDMPQEEATICKFSMTLLLLDQREVFENLKNLYLFFLQDLLPLNLADC